MLEFQPSAWANRLWLKRALQFNDLGVVLEGPRMIPVSEEYF